MYRPFLNATRDELDAVLIGERWSGVVQPVWVLPPASSEAAEVAAEVVLVERLAGSSRVGWRIDAGAVGGGAVSGVERVDALCRSAGVGYVPVMSIDPVGQDVVAGRSAVRFHAGGVVIRVASPLGLSALSDLAQALDVVRSLGLRPGQADVVFDCGFVPDADAAARTAGGLIVALARALTQGWRSVTALAGAIPAAVPTPVPDGRVRVARDDAGMFRQLAFSVDFGDFGLAHPQPAPLEPPPEVMWWNTGESWVGYPTIGVSTSELRRRVAADGFLRSPPTIATAQAGAADSTSTAPDVAAEWPVWATAHHAATVVRRLAHGSA